MKKRTGIWLDYKDVYIVDMDENGEMTYRHLNSHVDMSHPKGGSRSKSEWGPQGGVSERNYLERREHQEEDYYEKIMEEVKSADELVIFGAGQAKKELKNVMHDTKHFHPTVRAILTAHPLSEGQLKARVREYFENPEQFEQDKEE